MATTETAQPRGTRRWVRVLLFVSLALNLMVVGLAAGMIWRGLPDHREAPQSRDQTMPYTRALERDDQRALRRQLREAFAGAPRDRGDLARAYRRSVELLRAEPFDPDALRANLDAQSRNAQARLTTGQKVLADYLATMSPSQRAAYADRLEQEITRFEARAHPLRD
ncbi:periplasmic heavy metal sensor [Mesobacterium sp. TK19101]|uniref:Periplasmic heavy metal sensor n=1 Tax=Mesobacterium hydrothermale TaxID=3111907 RepID=A0ABU6HIE2_9RHOB|nr:periplasmic heavy metal sensor [Mesobacterium sp. TK19101]MEC3861882.1 periplasmic heavy metal sensor [Mesobacterium sp. TK19101]